MARRTLMFVAGLSALATVYLVGKPFASAQQRPADLRMAAVPGERGGQDIYIEKESELEALLLNDKLERFEIKDNEGRAFKLTDVRWQRYTRLLKQYEGWSSALRAEHGHEVVQFLEESQILDNEIKTPEALLELVRRPIVETVILRL